MLNIIVLLFLKILFLAYRKYITSDLQYTLQLFCSMNKTITTSKWNVLTLTSSASHITKVIIGDSKSEWFNSKSHLSNASMDFSKFYTVDSFRYQAEEKYLQHCVVTHLSKLNQIYNKYATICSTYTLDFKPAMVRMFLWQLWRDLGIVNGVTSICDINLMLNENPCSGYETVHCPFEKIYFWQFLQVKTTSF